MPGTPILKCRSGGLRFPDDPKHIFQQDMTPFKPFQKIRSNTEFRPSFFRFGNIPARDITQNPPFELRSGDAAADSPGPASAGSNVPASPDGNSTSSMCQHFLPSATSLSRHLMPGSHCIVRQLRGRCAAMAEATAAGRSMPARHSRSRRSCRRSAGAPPR